MTRAKFEELSAHLLEKALFPIDEVLRLSGKSIDEVDVIEIIGGGVRVPRI